jgi:hypothetical protein
MQSGACAAHRFGKLKHGNPTGDPSTSPRCGARTRSGKPCLAPAMRGRKTGAYTRCRLHGGASTGPRTLEGLERCRRTNWKHGKFSAEQKTHRRALQLLLQIDRIELQQLKRAVRLILEGERHAQGEETPSFQAILVPTISHVQRPGPK